MPDEPVFIKSDGKKLYRVFQNLIPNVLLYSLPSSRVYLDLMVQQDKVVEIKNISNYEMNFNEKKSLNAL